MTLHFLFDFYGKPYGLNYVGRYSLCFESIGSTFAHNVVGTVHISAYLAPIFRAIQAVSPSDALSTKDMQLFIVRFLVGDRIKGKKTRFAGVTLFSDFQL